MLTIVPVLAVLVPEGGMCHVAWGGPCRAGVPVACGTTKAQASDGHVFFTAYQNDDLPGPHTSLSGYPQQSFGLLVLAGPGILGALGLPHGAVASKTTTALHTE